MAQVTLQFVVILSAFVAVAVCFNCATLDPNNFVVAKNYPEDKLFSSYWHEHLQWTLKLENDTWTSYFIQFSPSRNKTAFAEFSAGGKPKTKCTYSTGSLLATYTSGAPTVANLDMKTITSSGKVMHTSAWLLDQQDDPFFAMVQCDSYKEDWSNYTEGMCPAWRIALYYGDWTRRSESEYATAAEAIEQRICFSLDKMSKAYTSPSNDCANVPMTTPNSGHRSKMATLVSNASILIAALLIAGF